MTRATVRRWTLGDHPNPWAYSAATTAATFRGTRPSWRSAYDRALQILADQT